MCEINVAIGLAIRGFCDIARVAEFGYARVSTSDQDLALQVHALEAAGCSRVLSETASGARAQRPQLERLLDQLREGDTLVVWRLDRLGRSVRHLVSLVEKLDAHGVGFRALDQQIDTTTASGRLQIHLFAALAEFERELGRERTRAGLQAARARGRRGGRPRALSADQVGVLRAMHQSREHTVTAIAAVLGVSRATIYRELGPGRVEATVKAG